MKRNYINTILNNPCSIIDALRLIACIWVVVSLLLLAIGVKLPY